MNGMQQQQDAREQDMSDDDEFERALNQDTSDEEERIKAIES
jgi:hypothetical protein